MILVFKVHEVLKANQVQWVPMVYKVFRAGLVKLVKRALWVPRVNKVHKEIMGFRVYVVNVAFKVMLVQKVQLVYKELVV